MSELDLNAPITEWELDEWTPDARAELTAALIESGIAHKWEETVLLAASAVENEVEEMLDEIENNIGISDDSDDSDDDDGGDDSNDVADSKVLGQLSALAQRISRNPSDTNAIRTLERLLEEIDGANAPREISDSVWRQVKDLANQIEESLIGSSQPDESTAMDLAGRLFAILRSNV
ncbi:MAG: hypothetical protein F2712_04470 [Actinobacteria bacterium]|uniref:Unannotated protein n=1 Tax=freshwater metagenome TaxID=449393 RepID=A0A6J6UWW2_9ZZZZ|nr:hypothetical protein [Actinomycetota bacterium]